jgi:hypothetical protein
MTPFSGIATTNTLTTFEPPGRHAEVSSVLARKTHAHSGAIHIYSRV